MCISLRLTIEEFYFVFQNSPYEINLNNRQDSIVMSNIENNNYDIHSINELLYLEDLPQLGSIPRKKEPLNLDDFDDYDDFDDSEQY